MANPKDRLASYLAVDINLVVNLDRKHEIETTDMKSRERDCEIQVADYVISNFRRTRLFYMFHHPTEEFMTYITMQLFSRPEVAATLGRTPPVTSGAVRRWLDERKAFYGQSPVHPGVAEHFELEWYDPGLRYEWLGRTFTFTEWTEFYLNYDGKIAGHR